MASHVSSNGDHCATNGVIRNKVKVVLGSQWGDEGKGKIVDLLATKADVVCRVQGGNNAGHTVVIGEKKYDFHLLPSGIISETCLNVIGNGVVVNLPELLKEAQKNEDKGLTWWKQNLVISDRAHLVFNFHQEIDAALENMKGGKKLGTTKKGIGPTYSTKCGRINLRVHDLMGDYEVFQNKLKSLIHVLSQQYPAVEFKYEELCEEYKQIREIIRPMVKDTVHLMYEQLHSTDHKEILIEGANANMLDIDFGTYPYVTSSNCSVGGLCTGLGVPPSSVGDVIAIVKAYTTRVGAGPFPSELTCEIGERLQTIGHEYGVTTGRKRRCGWLDLMVVKYAHVINNFKCIALTKLDILDDFETLKIAIGYKYNGQNLPLLPASLDVLSNVEVEYIEVPGWKSETSGIRSYRDLPENARNYIECIEKYMQVPVKYIGVGQARDDVIVR